MNFPSIDIQGSILSAEILGKIRAEQEDYQQGKDFNPSLNNSKLKDEISLAWQDTKAQWTIFNNKLKRSKQSESAATETRQFWIIPLLANLGYDFQYLKAAEEINGKSFWINFRDQERGGFPLYIAGVYESLDKRPENKSLRISPHALVQEYLNYSEHLYGFVTNGKQFRLLRDASRLTRLSYLEFNLEKILEEDLYADFVIFYRLLHASRMPQTSDQGPDSIIEKYHQKGLEAGATIRNKLGSAVKQTIENLANGFINHPKNQDLRQLAQQGTLPQEEYYRQMLRIIYRILYLFVIEERNVVFNDSKDPQIRRFSQIYYKHYSLLRLRKLAKRVYPPDASHHYDLWMSLVSSFSLFEKSETGNKLGIMALQGDLFNYGAIATNSYNLHECYLSNSVLLSAIKALAYFENDQQVLIAVNYGGLDVEEFGSVYEGLLELKLEVKPVEGSDDFACKLAGSSERSKSGSHYTPEELVQPLIKHSLQYLIDERKDKPNAIQELLNLKICDVACGSGHILLSAARKIALEVACLRETEASNSKEKIEQPSPLYLRRAMREVIRNCIFGVDKNPLAVELCKVALWLEAHNPGEPLNFLDHHIKCGDAIVGLSHRGQLENGIADQAFKAFTDEEKEHNFEMTNPKGKKKLVSVASAFTEMNKGERKVFAVTREGKGGVQLTTDYNETIQKELKQALNDYESVNKLPETTPEEISNKKKAHTQFLNSKGYSWLKLMADTQIGQFFIPKTLKNKDYLVTDKEFRQMLAGYKGWQGPKTAKATAIAQEKRFFHWFLEFPEVFQQKNGFDCVLGNPPFLGGQKLTGAYGNDFLEYIKFAYDPIGAVDLVTYFFRRIFNLLNPNGFQSLISTNTIAQGSAREGGLDVICAQNGIINHAVRSMRWPGQAAVEVSLVTIHKGHWNKEIILDNKKVDRITPYLDDSEVIGNPWQLKQNSGKSFQGSIVLGKGFILSPEEAGALIAKDARNKDVLFPYLNGDDLNNDPEQKPSRWVINFFDWDEEKARSYPDCFKIIELLVKPERQRWEKDKDGKDIIGSYALRKPLPQKWWIYGEKRPALYNTISKLDQVMVIAQVSKTLAFTFVPRDQVISMMCIAFAFDDYLMFGLLQNSIHHSWVQKYASALKSDTRYTPSDVFDTYPMPHTLNSLQKQKIVALGKRYYAKREFVMKNLQIGLTKVYNLFHNKSLIKISLDQEHIEDKIFENKYGKDNLWLKRHLKNNQLASYNEVVKWFEELRILQSELDLLVVELYQWHDLKLQHDFYELEHLSENDRLRFTIHPDNRKEVLKRLLKLNNELYKTQIINKGLMPKSSNKKKKNIKDDDTLPTLF
jgi:hypothetical protein